MLPFIAHILREEHSLKTGESHELGFLNFGILLFFGLIGGFNWCFDYGCFRIGKVFVDIFRGLNRLSIRLEFVNQMLPIQVCPCKFTRDIVNIDMATLNSSKIFRENHLVFLFKRLSKSVLAPVYVSSKDPRFLVVNWVVKILLLWRFLSILQSPVTWCIFITNVR